MRQRVFCRSLSILLGVVTLVVLAVPIRSADAFTADSAPKPTVVLVHGAFADASGWNDVTKRLQGQGYPVLAPANPERGLHLDSLYLSSVVSTIAGPVILVGHSYGGAVITNAATTLRNVQALVYIAAFGPDLGETVIDLVSRYPGSGLTSPENLILRPYPAGVDAYINPRIFHQVFAADLPAKTAAMMAVSQRPAEATILVQPSGLPAWRTIPSWYLVARSDKTIPPAAERFMAERMGATTVEIESSHVAMMSHPGAVADLIIDAAEQTR